MMSEREEELSQALGEVNPEWSSAQTERALARLQSRIQRRKVLTISASALLLAAACVALTWLRLKPRDTSSEAPKVALSEERIVRFSDGSTVHLADANTDVSIVEARPERIVAALEHGRATFEVSHVDGRVFRVQAGLVIVEALGTVFTVDRGDTTVGVSVGRGRVRVDFGTGSRELAVGQSASFPPPVSALPTEPAPALGSADPGPLPAPPSASAKPASAFRELAAAGKSAEAYRALASTPSVELNSAEALLLAADVARLAGHPNEAVPYLERVLREFKGDPRASLAAFSLGRVLMNSLGRPAQAAGYFERARALSHEPSLAEDALAREVEALARAGQADRAKQRAEDYLRLYPGGQRVNAVKTFGGIE